MILRRAVSMRNKVVINLDRAVRKPNEIYVAKQYKEIRDFPQAEHYGN